MYCTWKVTALKAELKKRGASLRGKKADLMERLEMYDKNFNFGRPEVDDNEDPAMDLPDINLYRDINSNTILPPINKLQIRAYFQCLDKKLTIALQLYEARCLLTARSCVVGSFTYVKGFCKKTMKSLQYEVDVKLHSNGTPEESHCECPAGSGTNSTCKHVAVLLYGIEHMVRNKIILLTQVCTQQLQQFHAPKSEYTGTPMKAHKLPTAKNRQSIIFSPYPVAKMNVQSYNDSIRNSILNYGFTSMPLKQMYGPANPHALYKDHQYTAADPEKDCLNRLRLIDITIDEIVAIEENTRAQRHSLEWVDKRRHRLTASNFYNICHLTPNRMRTYSKEILKGRSFTSRATTHGIINEGVAIAKYCELYSLQVKQCGLFISKECPFLAATPDGLLGDETIIEVKCPYSSRNMLISSVSVPYLKEEQNMLVLKENSPAYYQIQGQLYCTNRKFCNLIVYTYIDIKVIFIDRNENFITEMLTNLKSFYNNYFKNEILEEYLYFNYADYRRNKTDS